ncbi:MAG: hypothetical protein QM756_19275 [Polyangiaceae bacterium]
MKRRLFALCVPLLLTACPKDREQALTLDEASQALEESTAASEAEGLTSVSVDISTNFTIGQGVEQALTEVKTFVASQLPCADTSIAGTKLTVVYGAKAGSCVYRGHQFSGTTELTVSKNDAGQVVVDHDWTDFSNGVVSVTGSAHVTWDGKALTRNVQHSTTWTHLASGRVAHGSGNRTQSALNGDITQGIRVDGSRSWQGERGSWELAISGVEMRWSDPVPQAGSYTLSTPFNAELGLAFARKDVDTIHVTVSGPKRSFGFDVSKAGTAQQAN